MKRSLIFILYVQISAVVLLMLSPATVQAQALPKDEIIALTPEWKGERYADGRPKVPDAILKRMRNVSLEEAWGVLRGEKYFNQFEGDWKMIHEDQVMVGRALTAQYMPNRPDLNKRIAQKGEQEKRIGGMNSWPIDMLQQGDIYVADSYGKMADGTLIGDNLGTSIYTKSGNGVVFNGSLRDLEGLTRIEGFNAFVRGWHPSYLQETVLSGINVPIRIGQATVLPGDVVLAKRGGVLFIPAHLAEKVVTTAEIILLRDEFGHARLREGKYTPGEIDTRWTDTIEKDFSSWLRNNIDRLPVPKEQIQEYLKNRTW